MIKTRTKKIEAEEKARRERKTKSQQQTSGGSSSSDNDGSKEGRRAERERRREEHREKTGATPKTQEEIAEIERQRRIRMEDAERAWTVQDGDLPPEGEPVADDGDLDDFLDGDSTVDAPSDSKEHATGDGDDEDVLDLD